MSKLKNIFVLLSCLCLGCIAYYLFFMPSHSAYFIDTRNYFNKNDIVSFTDELGKLIKKHKYSYDVDVYTANFIDIRVPDIINPNHKNILILGSRSTLDIDRIKKFDFVFVTTPDLQSALKAAQIDCYYLPLFIEADEEQKPSDCVLHPEHDGCFLLVVGEQPNVIKILENENYKYEFYPFANLAMMQRILPKFHQVSGIIFNVSKFDKASMDISPLFLYAANQQIPMLADNIYNSNPHNYANAAYLLFADTLSYYSDDNDIMTFLNCSDCKFNNGKKAKFLVDKVFSSRMSARKVFSALNVLSDKIYLKNVVNVVSPTYAGRYNNGDYWIAKDLENGLDKFFKQTITSFSISLISDIGNILLYIRGGVPLLQSKITPDTVSIFYLLFPSFNDYTSVLPVETFINKNLAEMKNTDAVAVASEKIANILKTYGIDAYYVPQFTNTQKFYPDFQEDLQTDVLFVGNYLPYRRAAFAVHSAGLPITIYGNNWPDGLAKADYIDNRILRKYYSSAKIVLNDTRDGMKQYGFIINRIFDVTATGTLMISDYMKEIEEVYGDCVPMWKTEEELVELVKYYLAPEHEADRLAKAKCARDITLKNFTSDIAAQKFMQIIDDIKKQKGL